MLLCPRSTSDWCEVQDAAELLDIGDTKVIQTQLDVLQIQNIFSELESLVNNIISIGDGSQRLIIHGTIYHINEHHYTCNNDELKCIWEIDTRILTPVSVKKKKCKATSIIFFNFENIGCLPKKYSK